MRQGRTRSVNLAASGVRARIALSCLISGVAAGAALAGDPLAETVPLGTVATLAPLCGLRDEGWAEDLRRAALQSATGTPAGDDEGLRAAPGSDLAAAALGYAEAEALEDFAEMPAEATCKPLAAGPALGRADDAVRAFRAGKADAPRF